MLKVTRRPREKANPKALAETFVLEKKGKVWLLKIPNLDNPTKGHHLEKGTIYLALSVKSANSDMVNQVISYRQSASLFMPDLIAHKGYDQIRQYRLHDKQKNVSAKITSIAYNQKQQLKNIESIVGLDRLRISLGKQIYNYSLSAQEANGGEVIEYHATKMNATQKELEFTVEEGRSILQATDTAVTIVQARLQWRIEIILASAAVGVAASQLVNEDATKALLALCGCPEPGAGYDPLLTLEVRFLIALILVVSTAVSWLLFEQWWQIRIHWLWKALSFLLAGSAVWRLVDSSVVKDLLNLVGWPLPPSCYEGWPTLGGQVVLTVGGVALLTFIFWLLSRLFNKLWRKK